MVFQLKRTVGMLVWFQIAECEWAVLLIEVDAYVQNGNFTYIDYYIIFRYWQFARSMVLMKCNLSSFK
jgi:hypothetical protein